MNYQKVWQVFSPLAGEIHCLHDIEVTEMKVCLKLILKSL